MSAVGAKDYGRISDILSHTLNEVSKASKLSIEERGDLLITAKATLEAVGKQIKEQKATVVGLDKAMETLDKFEELKSKLSIVQTQGEQVKKGAAEGLKNLFSSKAKEPEALHLFKEGNLKSNLPRLSKLEKSYQSLRADYLNLGQIANRKELVILYANISRHLDNLASELQKPQDPATLEQLKTALATANALLDNTKNLGELVGLKTADLNEYLSKNIGKDVTKELDNSGIRFLTHQLDLKEIYFFTDKSSIQNLTTSQLADTYSELKKFAANTDLPPEKRARVDVALKLYKEAFHEKTENKFKREMNIMDRSDVIFARANYFVFEDKSSESADKIRKILKDAETYKSILNPADKAEIEQLKKLVQENNFS